MAKRSSGKRELIDTGRNKMFAVNESKSTATATVRLLKHARRNHQPHR